MEIKKIDIECERCGDDAEFKLKDEYGDIKRYKLILCETCLRDLGKEIYKQTNCSIGIYMIEFNEKLQPILYKNSHEANKAGYKLIEHGGSFSLKYFNYPL